MIGKLLGRSKIRTTARCAHLARESAARVAGRSARSRGPAPKSRRRSARAGMAPRVHASRYQPVAAPVEARTAVRRAGPGTHGAVIRLASRNRGVRLMRRTPGHAGRRGCRLPAGAAPGRAAHRPAGRGQPPSRLEPRCNACLALSGKLCFRYVSRTLWAGGYAHAMVDESGGRQAGTEMSRIQNAGPLPEERSSGCHFVRAHLAFCERLWSDMRALPFWGRGGEGGWKQPNVAGFSLAEQRSTSGIRGWAAGSGTAAESPLPASTRRGSSTILASGHSTSLDATSTGLVSRPLLEHRRTSK